MTSVNHGLPEEAICNGWNTQEYLYVWNITTSWK